MRRGEAAAVVDIAKRVGIPWPAGINPCPEAIAAFEDIAGPLFERHLSNVGESATLAATGDLLLPKLMSGEISIRDAEAMIAVAA